MASSPSRISLVKVAACLTLNSVLCANARARLRPRSYWYAVAQSCVDHGLQPLVGDGPDEACFAKEAVEHDGVRDELSAQDAQGDEPSHGDVLRLVGRAKGPFPEDAEDAVATANELADQAGVSA
jgi:hypothetical protein